MHYRNLDTPIGPLLVAGDHEGLRFVLFAHERRGKRDVKPAPDWEPDRVSLKEFVALAKANPGGLTYASSGPGSNKHLGGEMFKLMSGTDILHVAYKGSTGARNDLLGGHVNMMFDEIPSVVPNVAAGQVRALGVTGAKRSSAFPDVPTVSEAGVPGNEHTGWSGIMVPAGTPKPIVDRLNAEIMKLLAKPDVKATWEKQGAETMSMTPAEFDAYLHAELDKWTKIVKAANIKLQ